MAEYVCEIDDVPDGAATLVVVRGRRLAVARIGGEVFAVDDVCPHWGGPLSAGTVSAARRELICPWHRFRYHLGTGVCVAANLRPPIRSYRVTVAGNRVLADLPPPLPADDVEKGTTR